MVAVNPFIGPFDTSAAHNAKSGVEMVSPSWPVLNSQQKHRYERGRTAKCNRQSHSPREQQYAEQRASARAGTCSGSMLQVPGTHVHQRPGVCEWCNQRGHGVLGVAAAQRRPRSTPHAFLKIQADRHCGPMSIRFS
ncbi:MAG: hypothetical protein EOO65_02050 [Methanosarcinales archaeon]|nr:MAG: hypothetical protein EOO65_02050 [Methanosarcinales archaeon]